MHVYFVKTTVDDDDDHDDDKNDRITNDKHGKSDGPNTGTTTMLGAQFRGRGLLAQPIRTVQGIVLDESNGRVETLFQGLNEWKHESSVEAMKITAPMGDRIEKFQFLSHAVHDPLPVEGEP